MRQWWRAPETRKEARGEDTLSGVAAASSSPRAGQGCPEQGSWRGGRGPCGPGKRGLGRCGVAGGAGSPGLLQQLGHLHLSGQSRRLRGGGPRMPCPPLLLGSQTEELQAEEAFSLFCKNLTPSDDLGDCRGCTVSQEGPGQEGRGQPGGGALRSRLSRDGRSLEDLWGDLTSRA